MPSTTVVSPTDGRFSATETCALLSIENWLLDECNNRRVLLPEQNGLYSEFSIAKFRSSADCISFVSKLRRQKDEIAAIRTQANSRTFAGKKKAFVDSTLQPERSSKREAELEEKINSLTSVVEKLVEESRAARLRKVD